MREVEFDRASLGNRRTALGLRLQALGLSALAAGGLLACSGSIHDDDAPPAGGAPIATPGNPTGTPDPGGAPVGGAGGGAVPGPGPSPGAPTTPEDPGRVSLRRLNRAEYNHTVRDLLGTTSTPADAFEADPAGFGYDNNGDVQILTTLQLEQYQSAAEALATEMTSGGVDKLATAARVSPCDAAAAGCIRQITNGLAQRAWRRPVLSAEIDRVMRLADLAKQRGEAATEQLRMAITGVLSSPHFIFRAEIDPASSAPGKKRLLSGYEIASRLSYLLYRSMPDDGLFAAATGGKLSTVDDVKREAVRMLADPKGAEFVRGFVTQWLDINSLTGHAVDGEKVGAFDRALAISMQAETTGFVTKFLEDNLPVKELLTARFTVLDARLAKHYGMASPSTDRPALVQLSGSQRRGLLTHASILTATSNPDRTSPVARGAWVMTHLLCAPPPPAPPDVPALPETPDKPLTARAQIEAHRADPGCAACHKLMDPIGLGLENYDAIGRWRDTEFGQPIDAAGELPDGGKFAGAVDLAEVLTKDARVPECLARNLFTYALGRNPEDGSIDAQHVARVVHSVGAAGDGSVRLRDLLLGIVTSDAFRMQKAEAIGARP